PAGGAKGAAQAGGTGSLGFARKRLWGVRVSGADAGVPHHGHEVAKGHRECSTKAGGGTGNGPNLAPICRSTVPGPDHRWLCRPARFGPSFVCPFRQTPSRVTCLSLRGRTRG